MAVLKRRTRMVNFRLTEDEYEYLKDLCQREGARSVSDFARTAVCRSIGPPKPDGEPLDMQIQILDGKVGELDRTVKQIVERMEAAASWRPRKRREPQGSC